MYDRFFQSKWILLFVFIQTVNFQAQERIVSLQEPFVVLLDPMDGTILDPEFIDLSSLSPGTPKAFIQVDDELWISDQLEDRIDRFDISGTYLGAIGGQVSDGGLDNIRGMAVVNNTEVWVTNAGTNNGAPGDAVVRLDLDGNNLGFFATSGSTSTFDIIDVGGEVYLSYIGTTSKIERRDYSGNVLGNIVEEGVVQFIQQIEQNTGNNSIYAAVFSTLGGNSSGLYEFSETDGAILNYWNEGNLRGVAALGNGNILVSNSSGVSILDPNTGISTSISNESGQYFGRLDLAGCTTPPAPTGDAEQTFNEGATLADIVVTPPDVSWFATETDAMNGTNALPLNTVLVDGSTYYAVNIVGGCLSDSLAVTVTLILGLDENGISDIIAYPNPIESILYIDSPVTMDVVSVYNLAGQIVLRELSLPTHATVDLQKLVSGVYVLEVIVNDQRQQIRIVKR
ncbi:MAG: T9SS type A sorting domain-containing protein [Bacteroidota bacterium]